MGRLGERWDRWVDQFNGPLESREAARRAEIWRQYRNTALFSIFVGSAVALTDAVLSENDPLYLMGAVFIGFAAILAALIVAARSLVRRVRR
jgi:hypothetical protein